MRHTRIEARHERHEALAAAPLPRSVRQGSFVVRRQSVKSEEQDALQVGHPRMLLGRRPEVAQSLDLRRFAQPLNGVRGGGRCRSSHMLTHTRNARHDAVVQHDARAVPKHGSRYRMDGGVADTACCTKAVESAEGRGRRGGAALSSETASDKLTTNLLSGRPL